MTAKPVRVLSIGCSCINRFQFDFFIQRHPRTELTFPRGLFDWNISSLASSINVLKQARDTQLHTLLKDRTGYSVAYDALIHHAQLPGFSFFHEDAPHDLLSSSDRFDAFLGKVEHLSQPFIARDPTVRTHVLWSNLQPNLPDTVENVIPWGDFVLTGARIDEVRTLGCALFGADTTFRFLSTPEDADADAARDPDTRVIELPRGADYQGPPELYETLLSELVTDPH